MRELIGVTKIHIQPDIYHLVGNTLVLASNPIKGTTAMNSHLSRKKFLYSGLGLATVATFFKWGDQPEQETTAKFLTQDGELVEIDLDKLPSSRKAASKEDVKKKKKK